MQTSRGMEEAFVGLAEAKPLVEDFAPNIGVGDRSSGPGRVWHDAYLLNPVWTTGVQLLVPFFPSHIGYPY